MTRALVSARSFPWPLRALDAVPIETPACAATSLMVARLLSGSLTGKRLLQLSVQGQRLHIVIEPSLYRLDDGTERALSCQGKPIPDLEARFSLVAPRYQRTGKVGNVRKQAGCRLSPGKRGGRHRCFSRSRRPGAAPITALGASFPSREGNTCPARVVPRSARPGVLLGSGDRRMGLRRRSESAGQGVRRPRNRRMRVRRPPEPRALPWNRWRCPGGAPLAPERLAPPSPPGFLFFGLFLPVSVFIAPIF